MTNQQRESWAAERRRREGVIMAEIRRNLRDLKRPPTIRELRDATGISSTSVVAADLVRLEGQGLIRLGTSGAYRSIVLVVGPGEPCPFCGGKPCDR